VVPPLVFIDLVLEERREVAAGVDHRHEVVEQLPELVVRRRRAGFSQRRFQVFPEERHLVLHDLELPGDLAECFLLVGEPVDNVDQPHPAVRQRVHIRERRREELLDLAVAVVGLERRDEIHDRADGRGKQGRTDHHQEEHPGDVFHHRGEHAADRRGPDGRGQPGEHVEVTEDDPGREPEDGADGAGEDRIQDDDGEVLVVGLLEPRLVDGPAEVRKPRLASPDRVTELVDRDLFEPGPSLVVPADRLDGRGGRVQRPLGHGR